MLNSEQKQAVSIVNGPVRIIAGAGTGKTFTLVERISSLIDNGAVSSRILCLTFTNKAAHELSERLIKKNHHGVNVMTFHSLAARLLRKFWKEDFRIINEKEKGELVGEIKDEDEECEMLDFDELLVKFLEILEDETLEKSQKLFDYVLVDEYQDVNEVQVEILKKLADGHGNICVVGDPDQTIYSWRGASAATLGDFEKDFPNVQTVFLTKNYRNPAAILKGAENLIKNNEARIEKKLVAETQSDGKINFWENSNEFQQYEALFYLLEKYLGSVSGMHIADELDSEGNFLRLSDIAILYRTQARGKMIAGHLAKKGYPFQISNGEGFWERKEVVKFIEELSRIRDALPDFGKFSDFITNLLENFIDSQEFTKTQAIGLQHLIPYSVQFDNLSIKEAFVAFLDEVKTEQEADNLVFADKINLLTLHAAKGLEFPVVLIFGLEDGEIPHKRDEEYWLEEERRLLYVGMTRAGRDLHLFYTKNRQGKGKERSGFLREIGLKNMFFQTLPENRKERLRKKELKKAQMRLF